MSTSTTEPRTKKFNKRIYVEVSVSDVQPGDIISFITKRGKYTRFVVSVTNINVSVRQPKGFKPTTKRVPRKDVKECWRWHKNILTASGSEQPTSP